MDRVEVNIQTKERTVIPLTQAEIDDANIRTAAEQAAEPMLRLLRDMAELDKTMPRYLEDHITADHGGVVSDPFQQAAYNAKIARRAEKP